MPRGQATMVDSCISTVCNVNIIDKETVRDVTQGQLLEAKDECSSQNFGIDAGLVCFETLT